MVVLRPMINEGTPEIRYLEDGWTVVSADNKLSAQYEHTIAVTSNGCEILTPWHLLLRKTAELAWVSSLALKSLTRR
jgi:methionyl aminopeptidase